MKVILDDMYYSDFFDYGGSVTFKDGVTVNTEDEFDSHVENAIPDDIASASIGPRKYEMDSDQSFHYVDDSNKPNELDIYGIRNVNFSLVEKDDSRWDEYAQQRKECGFDESELWNLDTTIANFIYPRIREFFGGKLMSFPAGMTMDEWKGFGKKMVTAFRHIVDGSADKHPEEVDEGLDLFRKYFFDLWS